ncbi:MAG TPA: hypothetical protein VHC22_12815 [Pirellulales bacterium]|nr:hypothetical protein [Pirellulales bacterium]
MPTDTDLLDRHLPAHVSLASRDGEEETPADFGAFGWLRGQHERAEMLELRRKDGNIVAFAYAWLERIDFDPSVGITLKFGISTVKITGRHLNAEARPNIRLFAGIVRHRVPWIQEADRPVAMAAAKGATVIEAMEVK